MDSYSLIEVAYMLYRVRSTIVDGECWLMEPSRKSYPFNLACDGWLGNLVQRFAYSFISQAFARRALIPTFVMVFFIVGERLARWSSWPSPITSILFTLKGNFKVEGGSFLQCMVQLSSLTGQSLVAWLCYVALERRDFQLESGFCLYVWYACYPLNLSYVQD